MCGENNRLLHTYTGSRGSSPRVRGKQARVHEPVDQGRLIPACAGKTGGGRCRAPAGRAHPRVCGENHVAGHIHLLLVGSSPRVRGKHGDARGVEHVQGLIPACAGKTRPRIRRAGSPTAHPRVCGENCPDAMRTGTPRGSSPRVRGKRRCRRWRGRRGRLIPACAGKTAGDEGFHRWVRAHPRVCGENRPVQMGVAVVQGSSPRVRGKHLHREDQDLRRGSSPRVRGKRPRPAGRRHRRRLIPACAGKTRSRRA